MKKSDSPGAVDRWGVPGISPVHAKKLYNFIEKIDEVTLAHSKLKQAGMNKKTLLAGLNAEYCQPTLSIEELITGEWRDGRILEGEDEYLLEHLIDTRRVATDHSQEDFIEDIEREDMVFSLLKELAEANYRMFEVIMFRFGFWDGTQWTLEAIGEQLDITRERVRQLEAKGLAEIGNMLLRNAILAEVRTVGVRRLREIAPPQVRESRPGIVEVQPRHRGRQPTVHRIHPPSELDLHTWAPPAEINRILGLAGATVHTWAHNAATRGVPFPEPRYLPAIGKRSRRPRKVYLISDIVDWAFANDRIVFIKPGETDG